MERNKVVSWKHMPARPLAPLWWWLYLEVCRRVFDISPVWSGVLYTVLVLVGVANTLSFLLQDGAEPSWKAPHA